MDPRELARKYVEWRMKQFPFGSNDPKTFDPNKDFPIGTGQIRPMLGPVGNPQGRQLLAALKFLSDRAPGFSRAMNKLPDVSMGFLKLPPRKLGTYNQLAPQGPTIALSESAKPEETTLATTHELLHHWFKNLPPESQMNVHSVSARTPEYLKHFTDILERYPTHTWSEEASVRHLTDKVLGKAVEAQ